MTINPVIEKELKTKMRGWKAPTLVCVYLGFLLLVFFLYFLYNDQLLYGYGYSDFNPRVAMDAFNTLAFFQLLMLLFITPAMTGGAISGERERQTLDLLLCTSFSTYKIVIGKIFVSIAHILLLITASLPIMSIVLLYGGVKFTDILLLFFFYIATAFMLGSLGTFYSAVFKKTIVSIIVTYITILVFSAGTVIIMFLWALFSRWDIDPSYAQIAGFLFSNPFFGFGSVIEGTASNSSFFEVFVEIANGGMDKVVVKSWIINSAFNIILSVVLIVLSAWKIRPVK